MIVKEFRQELSKKKATWTLLPDIDDDIKIEDLTPLFSLGALPIQLGVLLARMPKIRMALENKFFPW